MSLSKKRAAVVVPTAFLVALSGFGAAPALATDGGAPAAIVNDQADAATATVPAGNSAAVEFVNTDGTQNFQAGNVFWIGVTTQGPAVNGVRPDASTVFTQVTANAQGQVADIEIPVGPEGTTTIVRLHDVPDNIAAPTADNEANAEVVRTASVVDEVTVTAGKAVTVSALAPLNLREGETGTVQFNNLNAQRQYVLVNEGALTTVPLGSATATATVATQNGDAGPWIVSLYDVQSNDAYAAATTDTDRIAALGAAAATHVVNVAAVAPSQTVTDANGAVVNATDTDDATPAGVRAGTTAKVTFENIDALPSGQSYRVQVRDQDGTIVSGPTAVTLSGGANGFYTYSHNVAVAADSYGETYTVELLGATGTTPVATAAVPVLNIAGQQDATIQDRDNLAVEWNNLANGNYVLVQQLRQGDVVTTSIVDKTVTNGTLGHTVPGATTRVGSYAYSLYPAPTGTAATAYAAAQGNAAKATWLANNSTQLDTATVTVTANAVRGVATPGQYGNEGDIITFTFQNLRQPAENQPALSSDDFAVKVTNGDGFEQALTGTLTGSDFSVRFAVGEEGIPAANGSNTYTATLYNAPEVENWESADAPEDALTDALRYDNDADSTNTLTPVTASASYNAALEVTTPVATPVTASAPQQAGNIVSIPVTQGVEYLINGRVVAAGPVEITRDTVVTARATDGFVLREGTASEWTFTYTGTETRPAWTGRSLSGAKIPTAFHAIPTDVKGADIFAGDWNGDGIDTPGYRTGKNTFRFATSNDYDTTWSANITFGKEDDQIFVGDWDGNGTQTLGLRRGITVYLNNQNVGGNAAIDFDYGRDGDEVLVGDWDDDGLDTVSVRRGITVYLSNDFEGGWEESKYDYGRHGDRVLVGDWDGDGVDTLASRRGNVYFVNNNHEGGWVNGASLGTANQPAVVTNVEQNGKDEIFVLAVDDVTLPAQD